MAALFQPSRFRRPSRLKDRWYLPGLLLLLFVLFVQLLLSLHIKDAQLSSESLLLLQTWNTRLGNAVVLPILLFVLAVYRLRKQIYAREVQLEEVEQGLLREKHGLEQCIKERTAELRAEVDERRRADLLNRGRNQILEMLAKNVDLHLILNVLLKTVTQQSSIWSGALHQLQGSTLVLRASVGIPEKLMEHLNRIEADFVDAPEAAALQHKGNYIIEDTMRESTPWSQLLVANGIFSAWSVPFFTPEGVSTGTITIFSRLRSQPAARDLELLEMASALAALAFEHRRLHQELLNHAYHDVLTGLPNRRLGEERLAVAITRAKRHQAQVAVLWIDLNRFKFINDTYGHPIGDLVLEEIAGRLSRRLRESDTLARMGGDEFMVILDAVQYRESAEKTAAELHRLVAEPIMAGTLELNITTSIGISLYPTDGETAEQLKHNADHAMYRAKFEHVGTRSFSPVMGIEATELRDIKEELTHALQKDGFEIYYQPQCKSDGHIVGFEALLRFSHSRLGAIPPSKFIPIVEEMGLIVPLGAWVLRNVCRQSMEWQRQGYKPIPIAANISPLQFARKDFAESVAAILDETGLDPVLLELELTESLVMKDVFESAQQLKYLSQLGISIAIDDFGTGYSSLSYLHELPIDVLKIDRSFLEKLTDVEGTRPIVESVISMAHTLGLRVVAEGVETSEQLAVLCQSNCDSMQGYFFAPALSPAEAVRFLMNDRPDSNGHLHPPETVSTI